MLIINWKEEDYSNLNFYDLYELKYPSIYGKEIPYAMKEGAEYQIPKKVYYKHFFQSRVSRFRKMQFIIPIRRAIVIVRGDSMIVSFLMNRIRK